MVLDRGRLAAPQLYDLLRGKIIALELAPGVALSRARLAMEYDISQTPVREALLKLEEERLVDVFPQSGTRVSLIDLDLARETQFLRRSIELELVHELATAAPPELIDMLEELLHRQETLRDTGRYAEFTKADMAFHHTLYRAVAHRESLWRLVRSRGGHLDRLRRLHLPVAGKQDQIISDHRRILEAIRHHDLSGAQQAVRDHLSGTLDYAGQIQTNHPQLFKAA